jgi:hypothetical protein
MSSKLPSKIFISARTYILGPLHVDGLKPIWLYVPEPWSSKKPTEFVFKELRKMILYLMTNHCCGVIECTSVKKSKPASLQTITLYTLKWK